MIGQECREVHRRAPRLRTTLVVLIGAVIAAACGGGVGAGSSNVAAGAIVASAQYAAIKGPWLAWDKSTCRFKTAATHPSSYTAEVRKLSTPQTYVFTPYTTTAPAAALIDASVATYAGKAGAKVIQISNDYPSTSQPLVAASEAVNIKPSAVISAAINKGVYAQIQPQYERACIPFASMFNIPTPHPVPGFQSSFQVEGKTMADAAIKIINQRKWPADQIWILSCGEPLVAPGPGTLLDVGTTFRDTVSAAFNIPASRMSPFLGCNDNGQGALDARTASLNWLTAHPEAKYVVGSFWVDAIALGMSQALAQKGFGDRALVAGGDASDPVLKVMADGDPIFQIDADKNFIKWGIFSVSLAEDIAAGKPVPSYMDPGTVAVTPDNVKQVIADRAAFLTAQNG